MSPPFGVLGRASPWGSGARGRRFCLGRLEILLFHFFMHDGMPGVLSLAARHIVLARPAPQLELLDEIHFRADSDNHDLNPRQSIGSNRLAVNTRKYIG